MGKKHGNRSSKKKKETPTDILSEYRIAKETKSKSSKDEERLKPKALQVLRDKQNHMSFIDNNTNERRAADLATSQRKKAIPNWILNVLQEHAPGAIEHLQKYADENPNDQNTITFA